MACASISTKVPHPSGPSSKRRCRSATERPLAELLPPPLSAPPGIGGKGAARAAPAAPPSMAALPSSAGTAAACGPARTA
eukprot:156575-Chlamydomonas_euryale.AAC.6